MNITTNITLDDFPAKHAHTLQILAAVLDAETLDGYPIEDGCDRVEVLQEVRNFMDALTLAFRNQDVAAEIEGVRDQMATILSDTRNGKYPWTAFE